MQNQTPSTPFSPFILVTPRLILVPSPLAVSFRSYLSLYASLHANPVFCEMGFGSGFPAVTWSEEQTRESITTRDINRCWGKRGTGDFAVGLLSHSQFDIEAGRSLGGSNGQNRVIEGAEVCKPILEDSDQIEWVGYAGIRDATTTSMPARTPDDLPLPPWREMVELRYGVTPEYWGKGLAREAAEAVMQWGASERGVKRFIAETERENARSGRVLVKMGFRESGTGYWKDEGEVEWERVVG
jgi:RimJ/RimL family protein N-acetyltransferase